MDKIAVFGKPANGKSTLSKKLAAATGIKLYPVDSILYQSDGSEVDRDLYNSTHERILQSERWILEGLAPIDSLGSFYKRIDAADTLIYIDLSYFVTYWLVTKRLFKGMFTTPEGWPEGSSVVKGTLQSYKILPKCPGFWNDDFLQKLKARSAGKSLHVIKTLAELNRFVEQQVDL